MDELATLGAKETKSGRQFVTPGLTKAVRADRKARMGRNPRASKGITITIKMVANFPLAKACKDAVVPPKHN
jgi:DNA-binding protein HU-beta